MKKTLSPKKILLFLLALVVFFMLLSSVIELYKKKRTVKKHIKALEHDVVVLSETYKRTEELNERIATPEGKEYILRDKYRFVRPGEELIVVTTPDTQIQVSEPPARLRRFWNSIMRGVGLQ